MKKILMVILILALASPLTYSLKTNTQNVRVRVQDIEPFSYCSVPHQGGFSEMPNALNALLGIMGMQAIAPAGELIAIYHVSPGVEEVPPSLAFEVGFPITAQVYPQPPLQKKVWSHTEVATAMHSGPYENVADTIEGIFEWMDNNNYVQDGPILGKFIQVPSEDIQTDDLRTEIWIPIRK